MPPRTLNNAKSGIITSNISSASGIDIDAVTEIDIDAGTGSVSIDSTSGSITVGAALVDGQTLKLGRAGATEMIFTPHGTAGSEKISVANTAGDAVDAISITSTAGGITLDAVGGVIVEGGATAAAHILFKEGSNNGGNGIKLIGVASTANKTVTLPSATDTLVGKATTDTLTNKTLDQDGTGNSITNIANASIKSGAAIDSGKIVVSGSTLTQAIDTMQDGIDDLDQDKANIASPTFTGVPAAPTAGSGTNTTQLATTAYSLAAVTGSVATISTLLNGGLKVGKDSTNFIDFGTDNNIILKTDAATTRATINSTGISIVGAITATGDITALTSDKRLKKNVRVLSDPLDKLKVLSGFTYDWDQDKCAKAGFKPKEEEQIGVFAQDIQSVIPQAVKPAPFDTDDEGNSISGDNYLTVQYEKIVPLLIECIKEQQKQIDELKNR